MKLAVIALVRNEIDIAGAFLQHLDALFDYAVLMDHGSIDGTDRALEQACARRAGWTLWHVDAIGYHQAAFNVFAFTHVFRHTDADALMFLDADEFINVPDRAALEAMFARLTDPDRAGWLRWFNAVPDRLDTRALVAGEAIWRPPTGSSLGKVVISRAFFERHSVGLRLANGNHGLYHAPEQVVPRDEIGELLHLPLRSHAQIKSKVLAGVFAVMAQTTREALQCWHWYDILWRIGEGALHDEDLIGIAVHYGEQEQQKTPMSRAELATGGFVRMPLDVAFGRALPMAVDALAMDPARLVATVLRKFQVEDVRNSHLALDGNRLHFAPNESKT